MWMACHTLDEIAQKEGCSVQPVKDVVSDFSAELPENLKPAANHLTDFTPPIYNVWKQQEKTSGDGFISSVSENQTYKANAEHATDFTPPIYNIWKQQEKSNGVGHFGNSEVRWVDNLPSLPSDFSACFWVGRCQARRLDFLCVFAPLRFISRPRAIISNRIDNSLSL